MHGSFSVWRILLLATSALLASCVVIPYQPGSETRHELADVVHPELVRLSVGPRTFLEGLAKDALAQDPRLQAVDGQSFIDAASPSEALTLARLLDPATRTRIEPLDVDYLVLFEEPTGETLSEVGGGTFLLAAGKSRYSTTYSAAVIDLKQQRVVEQLHSTSVGTEAGAWLFYGVFIMGDTQASAHKGVVRNVVQTIAGERPEGPVRAVFLASEHIPSADEIEQRAAIEALRAEGTIEEWSLRDRPSFEDAPPPSPEEARVYVFADAPRAKFAHVSTYLYAGHRGDEVALTRMCDGGYFVLRVPAGELRLTLEWIYEYVGTWRDAELIVPVRAGETYYVRARVANFGRLYLTLADATEARVALANRVLLPSAREVDARMLVHAQLPHAIDAQLDLGSRYADGVHYADGTSIAPDLAEAYKWFSAAAAFENAVPSTGKKLRKRVASRMDEAQIAEGERRAKAWLESVETRGAGGDLRMPTGSGATPRNAD